MRPCSYLPHTIPPYATSRARYKIGEAFIHLPHARAMKRLENDLALVNDELSRQNSSAEQCESTMKELKVTLYAKFGRAINLDE